MIVLFYHTRSSEFEGTNLKLSSILAKTNKKYIILCSVAQLLHSKLHNTIQYTQTLPTVGWDYEVLLKLLRWLFIEQDVTYWSGNGREMLYSAILSI